MKCPYNRKTETQIQVWNQVSDENQVLTDGTTVTHTIFKLMDCEKENCGAYYKVICQYNGAVK